MAVRSTVYGLVEQGLAPRGRIRRRLTGFACSVKVHQSAGRIAADLTQIALMPSHATVQLGR